MSMILAVPSVFASSDMHDDATARRRSRNAKGIIFGQRKINPHPNINTV